MRKYFTINSILLQEYINTQYKNNYIKILLQVTIKYQSLTATYSSRSPLPFIDPHTTKQNPFNSLPCSALYQQQVEIQGREERAKYI